MKMPVPIMLATTTRIAVGRPSCLFNSKIVSLGSRLKKATVPVGAARIDIPHLQKNIPLDRESDGNKTGYVRPAGSKIRLY
jgi:hypothetical protein